MQPCIPCLVLVSVVAVCSGAEQFQSRLLNPSKMSRVLRIRRTNNVAVNDLALELFRRGNQNGDDSLSQQEIADFYRQHVNFPESLANFVGEGFIENGDQNNDGLLNFFETLAAIRAIRAL